MIERSGRFMITSLPLEGLKRVERLPIGDERGRFTRLFCGNDLAAAGWIWPVVQANHSMTSQVGAVRGMHAQRAPFCEAKLVSCLKGRIFDVAVDLRPSSATYLSWYGEELSSDNNRALLIPPGFAHGFQALSDDAEIMYFVSQPYQPDAEIGLSPLDPRLAITWPLEITLLSERDAGHSLIDEAFVGLYL